MKDLETVRQKELAGDSQKQTLILGVVTFPCFLVKIKLVSHAVLLFSVLIFFLLSRGRSKAGREELGQQHAPHRDVPHL